MSVFRRCSGALAGAALAVLISPAYAQRPLNPYVTPGSPQVMPAPVNPNIAGAANAAGRPMAYNVGVLGNGVSQMPGYGYNMYPPNYGGMAVAPANPNANPYMLSTQGGYNPYTAASAGMGRSPYSLSTDPSGSSAPTNWQQYSTPPYMYGWGMGAGDFGAGPGIGYGAALQGMASLTAATGQYWKDIQSARITREQSRQMALDTARRRIQFEMWYESVRPTAPKLLDQERATDIDRARKDPAETEVLSGRTLNVLLKSIQSQGTSARGPNIPVEEDTLKHLNLTGGTSSGNVGMLRDGVKLSWPDILQEGPYDPLTKRLTRNLQHAVATLKDREPVSTSGLRDIRTDFNAINAKLSESADDLSPSQYIEARRYMNQVGAAIKALSDPQVAKYFNNTWNAKGRTAGELIEHMTKEGLTFAPATFGDEAAYRAIYQALRAYEVALAQR